MGQYTNFWYMYLLLMNKARSFIYIPTLCMQAVKALASLCRLAFVFVCIVALCPKSTAMVMVGRSVSPNHTFSWASLNKQLFVHILSLVTDNNPS